MSSTIVEIFYHRAQSVVSKNEAPRPCAQRWGGRYQPVRRTLKHGQGGERSCIARAIDLHCGMHERLRAEATCRIRPTINRQRCPTWCATSANSMREERWWASIHGCRALLVRPMTASPNSGDGRSRINQATSPVTAEMRKAVYMSISESTRLFVLLATKFVKRLRSARQWSPACVITPAITSAADNLWTFSQTTLFTPKADAANAPCPT